MYFVFVSNKRTNRYITKTTQRVSTINRARKVQFDILLDARNNITFSLFFNYKHVSIISSQIFNNVSKIQVFASKRVLQDITSTTNNIFVSKKSKTRNRKLVFIVQANTRFIVVVFSTNDNFDKKFKNRDRKSRRQSRVDSQTLSYDSRSFRLII